MRVRGRSGLKAVFRAVLSDGSSRAVWFLQDGELWDRYQAVQKHLSRRSVPCLTPVHCAANSLRLEGRWYHLLHMEWVAAESLFDWLQRRAAVDDRRAIRSLAEEWRLAIKDLVQAQIAHGNLEHSNVLITPSGAVRLVDYDTMCVPSLVGRAPRELGVAPYQHPGRDGNTTLALSIDNFSAFFIYVGLRAIAAEPQLWDEFVVRSNYGKMLFRETDFDDPEKSALFLRLNSSPDADVQRLAVTLHELYRVRIDQVPSLDDLLFPSDQV